MQKSEKMTYSQKTTIKKPTAEAVGKTKTLFVSLGQEWHLHHHSLNEFAADLDEDFRILLAVGLLNKGGADVLSCRR